MMTSEASEVFEKVRAARPDQREAVLENLCRSNVQLRHEVEQMLLKAGAIESSDPQGETAMDTTIGLHLPNAVASLAESEGKEVGPYLLRQKIGEGGFGIVWMAEQTKPISRMVALKVVKAGMDTKQVLARFEAERQALAIMDHPNIARVLDAGETASGRPYFAMELVKGIPITEFSAEEKLSTRDVLALFRDVCAAVNHAHQKGIIHRDIKPSNVLVALHGDKAVPKVIDFGIAKATQQKLTDKTLFTRFEQLMGTPVYMSPEQAAMSGLDIDTRSDIYSLGVLLYELLVGSPPFDPKTLLSSGYDEMRRIIKEDEPPKPSKKLTESCVDSAARLPDVTTSTLKGDLDWVVMKAIEKNRSRRYETANAFAADIERYLNNEPVLAAAPSRIYLARKFVRRNRAIVGVAAAIVLLLITGATVSSWFAVVATRARDSEEKANQALSDANERLNQQLTETKQAELRARRRLAQVFEEKAASTIDLARDGRDFSESQLQEAWLYALSSESMSTGESSVRAQALLQMPELRSSDYRELWQSPVSPWTIDCVAASPAGSLFATGAGNHIQLWDLDSGQEVGELVGHSGSVLSMTFSRDGKRLYSGSFDQTIRVWDLGSRKSIGQFSGHEKAVTGVTLVNDGNELLSSSEDGSVRLWNIEASQEVLKWVSEPMSALRCVSASRDGEFIVAGGDDGSLCVWRRDSGKVIRRFHHESSVRCAAFHPDGIHIASGSWDNTLRIWSLKEGDEEVGRLEGGASSPVWSVTFSLDGSKLLSGYGDGKTKYWEFATRQLLASFSGHRALVRSVAFNHNGTRGIFGSEDSSLSIWDLDSEKQIAGFAGHSERVTAVAFSPNGSKMLSGSFDNTVRLWDVATRMETGRFYARANGVFDVAFSPDGSCIYAGYGNGEIHLWDTLENNHVVFPGEGVVLRSMEVSSDGTRLVAGYDDGSLKVWDTAKQKIVRFFPKIGTSVNAVAFSPDGDRVLAGSDDSLVRVWSLSDGSEISRFRGHYQPSDETKRLGAVSSVSFHPNGQWALSGSRDRTVRLWDVETGRELGRYPGHRGTVWRVKFIREGKHILSSSSDQTIRFWDVESKSEIVQLRGHGAAVKDVCLSPDHSLVLSGGDDRTLRLWGVPSDAPFASHLGAVRSVGFSPSGNPLSVSMNGAFREWDLSSTKQIGTLSVAEGEAIHEVQLCEAGTVVVGVTDSGVRIWDIESKREKPTLRLDTKDFRCIAINRDGSAVLFGFHDGTLRLVDLTTRKSTTFAGHTGPVASVAFGSQEQWVASASDDQTIRVWDVSTAAELIQFSGHTDSVRAVAFNPTDQLLVSCSWDRSVRVWDLHKQSEIARYSGHSSSVWDVAFSPDGSQIASCASDATVRLWDLASGMELARFVGHGKDAGVRAVAFSRDGSTLLSGSEDQTIRLWNIVSMRRPVGDPSHDHFLSLFKASFRVYPFRMDETQLVPDPAGRSLIPNGGYQFPKEHKGNTVDAWRAGRNPGEDLVDWILEAETGDD